MTEKRLRAQNRAGRGTGPTSRLQGWVSLEAMPAMMHAAALLRAGNR